jgi:hypothetical protein
MTQGGGQIGSLRGFAVNWVDSLRPVIVGAGFGVGVPVVVSIATAGIGQGIFRIEPNCLVVVLDGTVVIPFSRR